MDASWAESQLRGDVVVPHNMVPGIVTTGAGDNFNRATESVHREHHDVVNMVLYQPLIHVANGDFGNVPLNRTSANRTVKPADVQYNLKDCPNLGGKQPGPQHLFGNVNLEWFQTCTAEHLRLRAADSGFTLLRLMPLKMFELDIQRYENQVVPGWTIYHGVVSQEGNVIKTNIGYCPMLPGAAR